MNWPRRKKLMKLTMWTRGAKAGIRGHGIWTHQGVELCSEQGHFFHFCSIPFICGSNIGLNPLSSTTPWNILMSDKAGDTLLTLFLVLILKINTYISSWTFFLFFKFISSSFHLEWSYIHMVQNSKVTRGKEIKNSPFCQCLPNMHFSPTGGPQRHHLLNIRSEIFYAYTNPFIFLLSFSLFI